MKEVMVRIKSIQTSVESGEEIMEFATEAKLYEKNGALYLLYEESELSGMPGCKTRIRLRDSEVQMKRFGEGICLGHELKFARGEKYQGVYNTPFGPIEVEILTNRIENSITSEGTGFIDIDYEISLKGLMEGRNSMKISLM